MHLSPWVSRVSAAAKRSPSWTPLLLRSATLTRSALYTTEPTTEPTASTATAETTPTIPAAGDKRKPKMSALEEHLLNFAQSNKEIFQKTPERPRTAFFARQSRKTFVERNEAKYRVANILQHKRNAMERSGAGALKELHPMVAEQDSISARVSVITACENAVDLARHITLIFSIYAKVSTDPGTQGMRIPSSKIVAAALATARRLGEAPLGWAMMEQLGRMDLGVYVTVCDAKVYEEYFAMSWDYSRDQRWGERVIEEMSMYGFDMSPSFIGMLDRCVVEAEKANDQDGMIWLQGLISKATSTPPPFGDAHIE